MSDPFQGSTRGDVRMPTPLSGKVLLIGWDAADWKVIHPLMDAGRMPALQYLVENGVSGNISTLHPVLSPMLWTSIATGKRPFDHGVLGFSEPTADGKGVQPVTSLTRKTKAVWNILNQCEKRSVVVGWWPSHPAEPINGVMVSNNYQRATGPLDQGWPLAPGTIHPPELHQELAALRFHPDEQVGPEILPFVPRAAEIDQDQDRRLARCLKILCECTSIHSCATELIENQSWDFAAVYYDAIDHFCHGFMKYHPPRQKMVKEEDYELYRDVVTAAYIYHDMMLRRLLQLVDESTTVIVISDHGFHPDHLRPDRIPREPAGPAIEHRDHGIFVMKGPGIRRDELIHGASLLDVTPTVLTLFGLPIGEDMEGKPLVGAFEDVPSIEHLPSWDAVSGDDGRHSADCQLDLPASQAALEQLVALGYIEPPGDDQKRAVDHTVRELNYNLAQAYMDAERHGDAELLLEDLYSRYPLEYRFAVKLAMCYRALDEVDRLAPLVEELNTRRRAQAEAARVRLQEFAEVARQRRDAQGAREESRPDTFARQPDQQPRRRDLPQDDLKQPLFSEEERNAIRELRALARVNLAAISFLAGSVEVACGNPEKALEHLQQAEATDLPRAGIYIQVGEAYLKMERCEDAERSFERARAIDPVNPHVHMGLCRSYLNRGQHRRAAAAALKTVGLRYHYPLAHYCLGMALCRMGDADRAVQAFEAALSQNPNFAECHEQLAKIHEGRQRDADKVSEHQRLAAEIRQRNQQRKRDRQRMSVPVPVQVDMEQLLPAVPGVAAADPQQSPAAESYVPRINSPRRSPTDDDTPSGPFVTVVTGLPRSGTSMMMQMLRAAGMESLTDGQRTADEDNPRGYFEFKAATQLRDNPRWVSHAQGKVVKVVAQLVPWLPQGFRYRVVFMDRDIHEVLASQQKMLERQGGQNSTLSDNRLHKVFQGQLAQTHRLLTANLIPMLNVSYARAIENPSQVAAEVAEFLGPNVEGAPMAAAIDPALYRRRNTADHRESGTC